MAFDGKFFDGESSRAHSVKCEFVGDMLQLTGDGFQLLLAVREIDISEGKKYGNRVLRTPSGGVLEMAESEELAVALYRAGARPTRFTQLRTNHEYLLGSVALLLILAVVGYLFILPPFGDYLARHIPFEVESAIGEHAFAQLDSRFFQPTTLSEDKQQAIRSRFEQMAQPYKSPGQIEVEFRGSESLGANAFTLPGGRIVLTDELAKALSSEQSVAILAHELGHAVERHPMKYLIKGSILSGVFTFYFGDVSALLATAPAVLLTLNYSREQEFEADAFGVRALGGVGLSPKLLAQGLAKLEEIRLHETEKKEDSAFGFGDSELLSTHPDTAARITEIERLAME